MVRRIWTLSMSSPIPRAVPCAYARPNRRFVSTNHELRASVSAWIDTITSADPILATEEIDYRRAEQLQRTLPTRVGISALGLKEAGPGQELPPGHHLVVFQPRTALDQLGEDGSSPEYNAPTPFLRRMWAGGSFTWNEDPSRRLIIGERVTESTRVARVEYKKDMVFVHQEKKFYPGSGGVADNGADSSWAVKEIRTHVFRKDLTVQAGARGNVVSALGASTTSPTGIPPLFTYTPTSPLLFRYSALTYNGHKIHYDRDWTRNIEGHPDLVVHGPLTATILIEVASKIARDNGKRLRHFEYRATSPMYVDREVAVRREHEQERDPVLSGKKVELTAEQERRVGMKATATID